MTEYSVDVQAISKAYRIRSRDAEPNSAGSRRPYLRRTRRDLHWALRDVSFRIEPGEAIGIVGRNGAGKSTLLKVLCRITEPTSGRAEMMGRVGCLLEVGTGFHPELTGMENIFLNGAILGMSKWEVRQRLDEIVDFSGVERFLDTPVKRYSSGMYVRLAFAVAAHLESEILVVDEVLSVGDAEFQKKCLGKMHSVSANSGRTVLFVSHSAAAVKALCDRVVVIDRGAVAFDGDVEEGLHRYQGTIEQGDEGGVVDLGERPNPLGEGLPVNLVGLVVAGPDGPSSTFRVGDSVTFRIDTAGLEMVPDLFFRIHLRNTSGELVVATDSRMCRPAMQGSVVTFAIERLPLLPGVYTVDLGVGSGQGRKVLDQVEEAVVFRVEAGASMADQYNQIAEDGSIYLPPLWSVERS